MDNIIYHYCSVETFLNILKNNTIRFSDLNKMNDYAEMKATLEFLEVELNNILCEELEDCHPIIAGCENETAIKIIVERLIHKIRMYNDRLIYAACFSKDRDLLSQWREYGDSGRGVAIGFNMDWLTNLVDFGNAKHKNEDEKQFKIDCIKYVRCKQDLHDELYETAKDIAASIISVINTNETDCLLTTSETLGAFLNLERIILLQKSAFLKVKDFYEEQEVRIIFDDNLEKSDDNWDNFLKWSSNHELSRLEKLFPQGLQFRAISNDIISYLDMRFDVNCDNDKSNKDDTQVYIKDKIDIIKEIVIGSNCNLVYSDITQLLLSHRFLDAFDIKIERSHATYRK